MPQVPGETSKDEDGTSQDSDNPTKPDKESKIDPDKPAEDKEGEGEPQYSFFLRDDEMEEDSEEDSSSESETSSEGSEDSADDGDRWMLASMVDEDMEAEEAMGEEDEDDYDDFQ